MGFPFISVLYFISVYLHQKYLGVRCSVLGILEVKQESPNEPSGNLTTQKSPPPLLNILTIIHDLVTRIPPTRERLPYCNIAYFMVVLKPTQRRCLEQNEMFLWYI